MSYRTTSRVKAGSIAETIESLVAAYRAVYGFTRQEINQGSCWEFASDLEVLLPEAKLCSNSQLMGGDDWDHAFVRIGDRYYDSEAPEGVTDWQRLPCCKRCMGYPDAS